MPITVQGVSFRVRKSFHPKSIEFFPRELLNASKSTKFLCFHRISPFSLDPPNRLLTLIDDTTTISSFQKFIKTLFFNDIHTFKTFV